MAKSGIEVNTEAIWTPENTHTHTSCRLYFSSCPTLAVIVHEPRLVCAGHSSVKLAQHIKRTPHPPLQQTEHVPPSMHPQGRETDLCLFYRVCLDSTVSIQRWSQVLSPQFVVVLYARPFEVPGSQANVHRDTDVSLCAAPTQPQLKSRQLALCSTLTGQSQDNKPSVLC